VLLIDQYFTHVVNYNKEHNIILSHTALRSPWLNMMLTGYAREDAPRLPTRLKEKIPFTAALLLFTYALLLELYPQPDDPVALCLAAALFLGYGLSLRPDEYLHKYGFIANDAHIARGFKNFFMWPNDPHFYVVAEPAAYPVYRSLPSTFLTLLDDTKNDPTVHGAPCAI
jgi:hypothetical protein